MGENGMLERRMGVNLERMSQNATMDGNISKRPRQAKRPVKTLEGGERVSVDKGAPRG